MTICLYYNDIELKKRGLIQLRENKKGEMINMSNNENEYINKEVGTWNLASVFKQPLTIPDFQRPYSWTKTQVIQLIEDIINAQKESKLYLIGNMILYKNNDKLDIIDGQQRITTLSLIFHVFGEKVDFLQNKINVLSSKRLKENYTIVKNYFQNFEDSYKKSLAKFLKEKIFITYIIADDLDEAFILFDSQNTRGKPLKRKDILKVHHLHKIENNRKLYAKKWEEFEKYEREKIKGDMDRLDELLYIISFIRKGIKYILTIDDLDKLDEFKELKTKVKSYLLNNYNQPPVYEKFNFNFETNELELITKPLQKNDKYFINGVFYLPYEILNSISGGEMFFAYVWKYFEIYKKLLQNDIFNKLDNLSGSGNKYLAKIYRTSLFLYFDKFGLENFDEFSKRVFLLLLYFRLIKASVRKEGVLKFMWNDKDEFNFYKEIMFSYSTNELIQKLDEYIFFNFDKSKFFSELKGTKKEFKNKFKEALKIIEKGEK